MPMFTTRPNAIMCAHRPIAGHEHHHRPPSTWMAYLAPSPRHVASTRSSSTRCTINRPSVMYRRPFAVAGSRIIETVVTAAVKAQLGLS